MAVSAFLGSGISALLVFYSDRVQGALLWMVGGLSARSWPQAESLFPYTVLGLLLAFGGAKALNILGLGDETARSLGLPVEKVRIAMTAVGALLAAGAVSVAGLISFVGLVVPHIVRLLIGSDHRYLIPGSAVLGAGIMVFCDTLGRVLFAPVEIPAGIIMAFLGAPFFLYLLRRMPDEYTGCFGLRCQRLLRQKNHFKRSECGVFRRVCHQYHGTQRMRKIHTAQVITANMKADEGTVSVEGIPLSDYGEGRLARTVAFLPQVHDIPHDMTSEELVACGRYPYQHWWKRITDEDKAAVDSAMSRTYTEPLRHRMVSSLSGGERQRIWIAMLLPRNRKF